MSQSPSESWINEQRSLVFRENPSLKLDAPCTPENGITVLSREQRQQLIDLFDSELRELVYFIPASGSGSRMFQFIHDFLMNPSYEKRGPIERFLTHLESFAFYQNLSPEMQEVVLSKKDRYSDLLLFLLEKNGLSLGHLPKGLIPFHRIGENTFNAFQEHVLQGIQLQPHRVSFHFTVQEEFHARIRSSVSETVTTATLSFSDQSRESDAIAFTESGLALTEGNSFVRRPAGHGALLSNLNALENELIFIKNIDNIQHPDKADSSFETLKVLGGLLIALQQDARQLFENPSYVGLVDLNATYGLYDSETMDVHSDESKIRTLLNRPIRICGMVRNEGQPGGGPFWVKDQATGLRSKQIVEKAQISSSPDQLEILLKSSHFNPVLMAISPYSLTGEKFDLQQFADPSAFFIVRKDHNGTPVRYMELPGLWNGSMANWNTVFIEVDSESFSPVKTVLDLLDDAHKPNETI
jgi:hypothetical protein